MISYEKHNRHQDAQSPPLILLKIVAYEAHGECQKSPDEPSLVVLEDAPAKSAERHLHQVYQRLAYQEENDAFQGRIQVGLAVHDDDGTEKHPPFKSNAYIRKGSVPCLRQICHEAGI